jgi:acyl phosphate:glycerol-3-phosphate acyltransferase
LKPKPQNRRAIEAVVLPFNDHNHRVNADSVFSPPHSGDISIIGEVFRKIIHLGAISIPIGYFFLGSTITIIALALALVVALMLDYIRIYGSKQSRRFIRRYLGIMIRPSEKRGLVGATYIVTGSILTILLFDKPIAIAAISFIVVGDAAGAIIGRQWGRIRFRSKSLEGSVSFFLACFLVGLLIPGIPFWVKVMGALIATIVEAITLHIDDNLAVPVTSAALMQVIVSQMIVLRFFS